MRIGVGPLSNLDWLYELRNGRAFALNGTSAPAAGQNGHVQIFNPVGSLRTIIGHKGIVSDVSATAGLFSVRTHNTALTTLSGNGVNLDSGAAAGVGEVRTQSNAGNLGTLVEAIEIPGSNYALFPTEWFIKLGAGEGILVTAGIDIIVMATFEWVEI